MRNTPPRLRKPIAGRLVGLEGTVVELAPSTNLGYIFRRTLDRILDRPSKDEKYLSPTV